MRVEHQSRGTRVLRALLDHDRAQICIQGPDGVGKRFAAKEAAKALLCLKAKEDDCSCKACKLGESHPDLILYRGEDVGIAEVREIRSRLASFPMLTKIIVLISDLDRVSFASAHGLLKTLEEPPPYARFLLTTSNPKALPQAVLSRCSLVDFQLLPVGFIEEKLRRLGVENPSLYARMAEGSMGMALKLSTLPALLPTAYELLTDASRSKMFSTLSHTSKDHLELLHAVMLQMLADQILPEPRIFLEIEPFEPDLDLYRRLQAIPKEVNLLTALKAALC